MNDHTNDWRNEVNWPYVRQFFRSHLIMWVFGFVLTLLSTLGGILVGATRKLLGVLALIIFAASLVGAVPIFGKAMREDHEGPVYTFKVFKDNDGGAWLAVGLFLNCPFWCQKHHFKPKKQV